MTSLFYSLLLVSCHVTYIQAEGQLWGKGAVDDGWMEPLFEAIGKNAEAYEMILLNALSVNMTQENINLLRNEIDEVKMTSLSAPSTYLGSSCGPGTFTCAGCKMLISVLRTLVHTFGLDYENIAGGLLQVCNVLMLATGYDRKIICPNILPHYVPHILYIVEHQKVVDGLDREDACAFMALCVQDRVETKKYNALDEHNVRQVPAVTEDIPALESSDVIAEKPAEMDIYRVAQLADIHFDFAYDEGSVAECNVMSCCRFAYSGKGEASKYGEYNCNIPQRTLELWLQKVKQMKPDVFLYSGDTPPHHLWFEEVEEHMNYTTHLAKLLHTSLPGVPVYPAVGNHDVFPSNMYYVPDKTTQLLHEVLISAYPELNEESKSNIRRGGYYLEELTPALRLLTYNTNFGYEANWYNILSYAEHHYADMKTFVEEALASAQNDGVKVIMMAHGPVGYGIIEFDDWVRQMCTTYHDVIVLHTTGHKHFDLFRTLQASPDSWASSLQFAAPTGGTHENFNPSLRIYELDRNTNRLVDFLQYRMDFSDIGSEVEPVIKEVYRASEEYALPDMSAKSWHKLALRMLTDTALLNKYQDNYGSGVAHSLHDSTCKNNDETCHQGRVCDIVSTTVQDNWYCCKNGVTIPPSTVSCVSDCYGLPSGNYQSCTGCEAYVTCRNGYLKEEKCKKPWFGKSLLWDDLLKICAETSSTCR